MSRSWRLLFVLPLLSPVAPVSAERLHFAFGDPAQCPHARAKAEAAATNAVPFLGLKRRSTEALMP